MSSLSRTIKRAIQGPTKKPKPGWTAEQKLGTFFKLRQTRIRRKDAEDMMLYDAVASGQIDLMRKDEPAYIVNMAALMGVSRGRLEQIINRVWREAKADIAREDAKKPNGTETKNKKC